MQFSADVSLVFLFVHWNFTKYHWSYTLQFLSLAHLSCFSFGDFLSIFDVEIFLAFGGWGLVFWSF